MNSLNYFNNNNNNCHIITTTTIECTELEFAWNIHNHHAANLANLSKRIRFLIWTDTNHIIS